MSSYTYIIIGGGLAGGNAADGIREVDGQGSLALVTEEEHLPYQRPPLSKGYLQGNAGLDKVYLHKPDHYREQDIEVLTGTRVIKVSPANHKVTLHDGRELSYDKLLLATGGRAWTLPLPGNDLSGVFTLRTVEDSDAIRQSAKAHQRALVLGGSFIGSEAAASLCQMGLEVTMVFPESRLLERVAPQELSDFLHKMYMERGVRILSGTTPDRLEGDQRVTQAKLSSGETLDVDLVVMGVGIKLNTELARDAGLTLGEDDAVLVDSRLRTSIPDIYAAGDIAAWPDPTFNKRLRVEHWDVARGQGLRAGRNMAGEDQAYSALPYFFSDLFDFSFEVWGNLVKWDQTMLHGSLKGDRFTFYYFDQGNTVGVLSVNPTNEAREQIPTLVQEHATPADIRKVLHDQ